MGSDQPAPPTLRPHYYRDNFLTLCDTVERRYRDLLTAEETAWLEKVGQYLSHPAQCLYIRLVSRVGPWFRRSRLAYPEIGELAPPLAELSSAGLLCEAQELGVRELGKLFTRAELFRAFPMLRQRAATGSKGELLQALDSLPLTAGERLAGLNEACSEQVIGPVGTEHVALMRLLFFGNRGQDLTEFVLTDLGVQRFYPYPLEASERLFSCREAVAEYLRAGDYRDRFRELMEAGESGALPLLAREMLEFEPVHEAGRQRWHRACNRVARELERAGEEDLALALYGHSQQHPARERRARVLEKQGRGREAHALCEQILDDPWCEAESEAAGRIKLRVARRLGLRAEARRREPLRTFELAAGRDCGRIELDAAARLRSQWDRVHYVENSLMCSLFGVAFWRQIFAPVPGVFHHPFQRGPADMFQREFYQRRRTALEQRLQELARGPLASMLRADYRRYHGYQCQWVNWSVLEEALLERTLQVIPAAHLVAIWRRILFDPAGNRTGFPDLVAFNRDPGDYCLIEIKGPGDRLQDNQRRWLWFFQRTGIPAVVARVEWEDA